MSGRWKTVAQLYRYGKVIREYTLRHDDRGYYWPGGHARSIRRKTRAAAERMMEKHGFDIIDVYEEF